MSRVLVTGANGFVGRELLHALSRAGHEVRAAVRKSGDAAPAFDTVAVGDIGSSTDWAAALAGVDTVIHTAARVHLLHDAPENSELYLETNARGTHRLALAAAEAGVRRLVFLSSVKVNGEGGEIAYAGTDTPDPKDAYARSKLAAEQAAFDVSRQRGIEVAVLRAPLVYGPGVRANFLRLMQWVWRERLLPLGAIRNHRSLIGRGNLCDLLCRLESHPAAAGRVWMAADGDDLSTPALVSRIAAALGRRPRLVHVPPGLLLAAGRLAGRGAEVARLCGSLRVDVAPARELLQWDPPFSVDSELESTARWFRDKERPHAL